MAEKVQSPLMLLRKRAGLNQQELARALGVSRTTIMRWETGRANPKLTLVQVKILCKTLQVTVEQLPSDFSPQPISTMPRVSELGVYYRTDPSPPLPGPGTGHQQ